MCLLSKDYLSLISNLLEMKYRWLPSLKRLQIQNEAEAYFLFETPQR